MDTDMDINMQETTAANNFEPQTTTGGAFQHHTLRLCFPAVELLPGDKEPFIERPDGVGNREEPDFYALGLSERDLEFFVRFPTDHGFKGVNPIDGRDTAVLGDRLQPMNLSACIDRLHQFPGSSQLSAVQYIDDDDVVTRFLLSTVYYTNFGKMSEWNREFEMSSAQVNRLLRVLEPIEEWARLLEDLIYSKTDRAYLCTRAMLAEHEPGWRDDDEEHWGVEWDENELLTAKQIFANRLSVLREYSDGTIHEGPIGDLADCRNVELHVKLPCGHAATLKPNALQNYHPRDALTAVCDKCDRGVMTRTDKITLKYCYDRIKRDRWDDEMEAWVEKTRRVRNDSSLVEINSDMLDASLTAALQTFQLPESINPRSMCPARYPESRALLEKLGELLTANPSIPAMTPKALYKNLEDLAWRTVKEMVADDTLLSAILPPGFDDFLSRWLTRAVNDAVGAQADDEKDEDLMAVMNKMTKAKIDPKEAQVEEDLDDILAKIGNTKLETNGDGEDDEVL